MAREGYIDFVTTAGDPAESHNMFKTLSRLEQSDSDEF